MNLKNKLTSRKLWAAIAGIVAGLALVFGLDGNTIETVAGAVVSVASIVTYIITEGQIDKAAVGGPLCEIQEGIELITENDQLNAE